jgi:hypothetical protein
VCVHDCQLYSLNFAFAFGEQKTNGVTVRRKSPKHKRKTLSKHALSRSTACWNSQ